MNSLMSTTLSVFLVSFLAATAWTMQLDGEVDDSGRWSPIYEMNGKQPADRGILKDIAVPAQIIQKRDTRRVRLCGDQLTSAMKLACGGRGKRSIDSRFHPLLSSIVEMIPQGDSDLTGSDFKPYSNILQRLDSGFDRRRRAGIVQACCSSPCTLAHLMTYC